MAQVTVLDEVSALIRTRISELDAERSVLKAAIAALSGNGSGSAAPRRGRPPGRKSKPRGGTRAAQAVALIESTPGISAAQVAKAMHIKPNYLYRVLGALEQDGKVKKNGRHYSAA